MTVERQTGKLQCPANHLLTMIGTLLGVEVEDSPLVVGKFGYISQHLPVHQRSRNDGTDIKSLLALRFPGRCREVAEGADNGAVAKENLRCHGNLVRHSDLRSMPQYIQFVGIHHRLPRSMMRHSTSA